MASTRSRVLLGVAFLVSAGLVGGAAVAFIDASDDKGSSPSAASASPTASATPEPTLSPTPSPTPEVTLTPTPTPTPSVSASAAASPRASASASPRVTATTTSKKYPYPKPTRAYDPLHYTATNNPGSGTTETTFTLTIKATDGDGDITFGGLNWGDGSTIGAEAIPDHCQAYPSPTAQPGPYQPKSSARTFTYKHKYAAAKTYRVLITVNSGNNACRPHGPSRESQTVELDVRVYPAPSPTPTVT